MEESGESSMLLSPETKTRDVKSSYKNLRETDTFVSTGPNISNATSNFGSFYFSICSRITADHYH